MSSTSFTGPATLYDINVYWDFPLQTAVSLNQFEFVTLTTAGYVINVATAGAYALGVSQDSPVGTTSQPLATQTRCGGPTKIQAGATFNPSQLLSSSSGALAVAYTGATVYTGTPYVVSGSQVLGMALGAGQSGYVTSMLFRPSGLSA